MVRKRRWLGILLAAAMLITYPVQVYAEENENDEEVTLSPYFMVENADVTLDRFPLKETQVSTNINGVIAETYITQTYTNEGSRFINAQYVFPVSTNVVVHGMTMEIGNERVTAQIKEREEAKEEYEEAKSEGKSASLLEQQRSNVFTMNIANIMPGAAVKVTLHYTQLITPSEGVYQFSFPTVVGPRYYSTPTDENGDTDQWIETPYLSPDSEGTGKYNIDVRLSTGVPISDISCKTHDINVERIEESGAIITLANKEDFAGDRDFILDYKLTGQEIQSGLMLGNGEDENFFMLMVQPPERVELEDIPPREYIFVLDVSGSMGGYPLDTAKALIKNLVSNLRETDSFNLVLFSGASSKMSRKSVPATSDNIQRAIKLIDKQSGRGGTELAPALEETINIPANEDAARSIIIITDGYISGEKEIFNIINDNLGSTSFFSFGIGTSVNRYLIEGIAKVGAGEAFIVTDSEDAVDTAERFRTYIQSPVLTNVQIKYDGFEVYDVEPSKDSTESVVPTLFSQKPIVIFGKWKGELDGTVKITGKSGTKDYVQEIQIDQINSLEANNAISYLWARTKVEGLSDYGLGEKSEDEIKAEVTALGLKYSMMTSYTSFIAVIDTIVNPEAESTDVDQPLPLPSQVSALSVGMGGYTIGSEPELVILIGALLIIISVHTLSNRKRKKYCV